MKEKTGGNSRIVSFFEKYLSFHKKKLGEGGQAPQLPMGATPMFVLMIVIGDFVFGEI